jgi:hypothetical protein
MTTLQAALVRNLEAIQAEAQAHPGIDQRVWWLEIQELNELVRQEARRTQTARHVQEEMA